MFFATVVKTTLTLTSTLSVTEETLTTHTHHPQRTAEVLDILRVAAAQGNENLLTGQKIATRPIRRVSLRSENMW